MGDMFVIQVPDLPRALGGAVFLYVLYYIYWQLTVGASRRAMIREHGCKPMRYIAELNKFPENVVGYKQIKQNVAAFKAHRMLEHVTDRFNRTENTMHYKTLTTDIISTIEPDNLKTIMATKFKDFSLPDRRKVAFLPLLGHGIFTSDGHAWQQSRDLIRPNFVRSQVGDLDTFEIHVAQLIKCLPKDGSTVDLQDLFFQLTIDSATEFLFGESTNTLSGTGGFKTRFAQAFNRSQQEISAGIRSAKIHRFFRTKQFREDCKFVHDFVDGYVEKGLAYRRKLQAGQKKEDGQGRYVFLYELAKSTGDPIQLRSELLNVLLAGRDTTASLLSDVFFILARRPDIWAKLRKEVDALDGKNPTFQQIKDMKYLRQVLNEALRLYPVVPINARMATRDTVIPRGGGPDALSPLFVPKGKIIQWSAYSMHRRKDHYGDDADEFRPERWDTLRPGWEYLPFNGGPRICIGQQFALTEASYTVTRLMQEFKQIEARDPRPWIESLTLTCAIYQGAKVGLIPA